MDENETQHWADEVSAYLFMLAFGGTAPNERPRPPVLGDSSILQRVEHVHNCACPTCLPGVKRRRA